MRRIDESSISCTSPTGGAGAAPTCDAAAFDTAASMSRLITRPCGPEPWSDVRSTPASAAIRSASGEARSARLAAASRAAAAGAGFAGVAGTAAGRAAGLGGGGGGGGGAAAGCSSSAEMSSSGAPMIAMSDPILTVSPGPATSFRMVPLV